MPTEKWYLNLVPGAKGNSVKTCGAKVDLIAKRKTFHSRGKGGKKKVEWTLVRDLRGLAPTKIDPAQGVLEFPGLVEERDDSSFRNSITLPPVTNVRYTVTARKPAQGQGATGNVAFDKDYETWRLIDYDVLYMGDASKAAYDAVKAKFIAAFAAVGFELKEISVGKTSKIEDATNRLGAGGILMTHLYDAAKALPNPKRHLRLVIVKDIVAVKQIEASWTLVRTDAKGAGTMRVWSTGDVVHYECPLQVMKEDPASGTVAAVLTPAVAPEVITRTDPHVVEIGLNNDTLRAAEDAAKDYNRTVTLKATLVGTRIETHKPTFSFDHTAKVGAPVTVGTTKLWAVHDGQANTWTLHVRDDQRTWATPAVKKASLEVQRRRNDEPGDWERDKQTDVASRIVRAGDHQLTLDVTTNAPVVAVLSAVAPVVADRPVDGEAKPHTLRVRLVLELAHGGAPVETAIEVPITKLGVDEGLLRYVGGRRALRVKDESLTFDERQPLKDASLRIETVAVAIPAGKATRDAANDKKIDLDLDHPTLDAVRAAFAQGGRLQFKVKIKAQESIGGYSPKDTRTFVALSTKRVLPTETDDTTRKRLLMCLLHELGHAHGLVSQTESFYSGGHASSQQIPTWYTDEFGGQGSHCSRNAELVPSGPSYGHKPTDSGQIYKYRAGAGKLCVMYHDLDTTNGEPEYCETCRAQLRLSALVEFT